LSKKDEPQPYAPKFNASMKKKIKGRMSKPKKAVGTTALHGQSGSALKALPKNGRGEKSRGPLMLTTGLRQRQPGAAAVARPQVSFLIF